jgi:hypothetical protein
MSTAAPNPEPARHEPQAAQATTGQPGPDEVHRTSSLTERGYVQARFGDVPVLIAPGLAAQLRAMRQDRSPR